MSYTPLTLSPSLWGYDFTATATGIEVTTPTTHPTVGQAFYGQDIGSYALGPVDFIATGGTEAFSFSGIGDALTGLITWLDVQNCDELPFMDGTLHIDTASGPIVADFPAGSDASILATSSVSCPLVDLATCGGVENSSFFGGRFIPGPHATYVSEPSSLALILVAVVLLGMRAHLGAAR